MKTTYLENIPLYYIVDATGKKISVILDLKTFDLIIEDLKKLQALRKTDRQLFHVSTK